jgi:hypothetical protein
MYEILINQKMFFSGPTNLAASTNHRRDHLLEALIRTIVVPIQDKDDEC